MTKSKPQRGIADNLRKFLQENPDPDTWGHDAVHAQVLMRDAANVLDALLATHNNQSIILGRGFVLVAQHLTDEVDNA